jgi:hypothetical protein
MRKYKNEIFFFETVEQAFEHQNENGGVLFINKKESETKWKYDIAAHVAEISDSYKRKKRYCVCVGDIENMLDI